MPTGVSRPPIKTGPEESLLPEILPRRPRKEKKELTNEQSKLNNTPVKAGKLPRDALTKTFVYENWHGDISR